MLALTPVAVLMFRFNNPDALLVLLLGRRGVRDRARRSRRPSGRAGWCWPGVLVGFGFLAKMLQAFLVLPALPRCSCSPRPSAGGGGSATCCSPGVAMLVSAGWWVRVVELWPADSRPYIGGSQNNSVLELTFGYNGFGRLTGDETGSVGGGAGGGWGETGHHAAVRPEIGGQVAWLLPAALVLLGGAAVARRAGPRAPTALRAASCCGAAGCWSPAWCSASWPGSSTPYYTVALAPAIGALVGHRGRRCCGATGATLAAAGRAGRGRSR